MINEELKVANIKCSGCAHTIQTKLAEINGVADVFVDVENDAIKLNYDTNEVRSRVIEKLHTLGYPEATEENGLLMQLKSYASCMVGRLNK